MVYVYCKQPIYNDEINRWKTLCLNLIVEDLLDMQKLGCWISFKETIHITSYAK
jgi:hypothetical protein